MGRATPKPVDTKTIPLFDPPTADAGLVRVGEFSAIPDRLWTENKAKMISHYVRAFTFVTKHGTYIEGFAGPQTGEANETSWSARLVLELEPAWIRRIVLCEQSPSQIVHLDELLKLRRRHGDERRIDLLVGDCNETLVKDLSANPIKPTEATFCVLDQRMMECHWSTVAFLSQHKPSGRKIELFYFVPGMWFFRALRARRDLEPARLWWGREVDELIGLQSVQQLVAAFTTRFREELGYQWVYAWPIFERSDAGHTMFYMIHATDHRLAPGLMHRAYRAATGAMPPMDQLELDLLASGQ